MAGVLRYKFKSELSYDSLLFDGMFLSVGDLKRQVAEKRSMIATELAIHRSDTGETYHDDSQLLARNTQVVISRVPLGPQTKKVIVENKEASRIAQTAKLNAHSSGQSGTGDQLNSFQPNQMQAMALGQDEAAALSNFVDASYTNWNTEVNGGGGRFGGGRKRFHSETPPPNYVCHRCGVGGHWIYNCPTNGNAEFDVKVVKAPVGIPLEKLVSTGEGTIVMPDGSVGDVLVDERELKQQSSTAAAKFKPKKAKEIPIPEEMKCPICSKLINDAVLILCCQTSFCDNCIRSELIETGVCPKCNKQDMLCDDLVPNPALRKSIQNHIRAQLNPQASLAIEGGKKDEKKVESATTQPPVESANVPQMNVVASPLKENTPSHSFQEHVPQGSAAAAAVGSSVPANVPNPLHQDNHVSGAKFQFRPGGQPISQQVQQSVSEGGNQREDSQVKSKPRFKVNAFRMPSKRVVESTKAGTSGQASEAGKQVVDILKSINSLLPDGPTLLFEEAFCMSHKPLSRSDFEYLQDDFKPKMKRPWGRDQGREESYGAREDFDSYNRKNKRKKHHQAGSSPPKSRPMVRSQAKHSPSPLDAPPTEARPLKRGGKRIMYDR